MGRPQAFALALALISALALALSAEFAGRWPLVQPPLARVVTVAATLLWLHGAPIARRPAVPVVVALTFGMLVWATAAAMNVALHLVRGEPFDFFEQLNSRAARGAALVFAHATFLGAPTGLTAGLVAAVVARVHAAR